ncbi:hypothetical protein F5Y16DRAFT_403524 [Xylariaceae sp. FL0255]|nr:hypothetical protein F5Y16DRAFT_403524 [Xylariaceae sp. FL0255]
MPDQKSSSSKGSGSTSSNERSTYQLAKDAGFKDVRAAGYAYGIKMHEPEGYDEINNILHESARQEGNSHGSSSGKPVIGGHDGKGN